MSSAPLQADDARIVATEEHFATDAWFARTAELASFDGERQEYAFTRQFATNARMRERLVDVDTRLAEMDAAGITRSVVSLNPPGVQLFSDAASATALGQDMNDALVELIGGHPDRFGGLGCVAPQDPEAAADEVARIMGPLGLAGVLIGSHTGGHYLDEPQFDGLLGALEDADAPLYLHPRSPSPGMLEPFARYGISQALWGFQAEASTHAIRLIMSGALDRHPRLRIVLGHLGEALPFWLWRLDNIYARTYGWAGELLEMVKLELTPTEYVHRNFAVTTSGMTDPAVLAFVIDRLGAEQIMFAVDYPYEDSQTAVSLLDDAALDAPTRALIAHANADRLFGAAAHATAEELR